MKKQILDLSAQEGFVCQGSQCPRDCCHGWDIEVDARTLDMWNELQDTEAKQLLTSFICISDDDVSKMSKTEEKNCIALNNKRLCSIQLQFGHEYLPLICRTFPRISFKNYYRGYNSASLSCPVIVEKALFDDAHKQMFLKSESDEKVSKESSYKSKLLCALDIFLSDVLEKSEYSVGVSLFFISDIFVKIINMSFKGELTEEVIQLLRENIDTYLSDISKAVKNGKLKPHPVTAGSFWKSVYELCEARQINKKYLDDDSASLGQAIKRCDDSFAGFSKVYSVVSKYRKMGKKQIKHQYISLFRKYINIIFVNKGFPLSPDHMLDLSLVDCMTNICVLQLLMWIEINKNGRLTDEFIKDCIIEVDRNFVQHEGVVKLLQNNSHMMQIEKYCPSFLDLF